MGRLEQQSRGPYAPSHPFSSRPPPGASPLNQRAESGCPTLCKPQSIHLERPTSLAPLKASSTALTSLLLRLS